MDWSLFLLLLMGQCSLLMGQLYDYVYIEESLSWSEAQNHCRRHHTDLATVYHMRDMNRLCKNRNNCEEGWIGLRHQSNNDWTWHWSMPGVEYNSSEDQWASEEPHGTNQGKEENYVIMSYSKWYDVSFDRSEDFICYNETVKNYIEITEEKRWLEAQQYCREHHTDLISGLDQLKTLNLSSLKSQRKTWIIGLFRDRWRWSDGNSSSFRNWETLPQSKQCAATTTTGRWKGYKCSEEKPFYCYNDNVILIQQNKTWDEALYYCRKHHYDLAYVTDEDEQRWVGQFAQQANSAYVWLGLHYTCTLQFWFWVTDERVHYENWASNGDANHCDMSGAMETGGKNKWYKKLDVNKYNFICVKN